MNMTNQSNDLVMRKIIERNLLKQRITQQFEELNNAKMTAFYARTLFCEKFMKTMETIKCQRINSCTLTTDVDDNNNPFVFASNGNATFGYLPNNEIFTYTHVKLSIGENRIDEHTGKNHGYGLLHIEARHGKEIRSFGFKSCCEFLIYILANSTTIKEGKVINNMRTYFIEVPHKKYNFTIYVQPSNNGRYWTINSAGVFRASYSQKRNIVYSSKCGT